MPDAISGAVEKTFYSDAKFSAGVLRTDDGERIRFRGRLHASEGDRLSALGVWRIDPKYGHQFEIQRIDYDLPQTRQGLINYLAKHPAFEGVGEKIAAKIVGALREGESLDEALRDRLDDIVRAGAPGDVAHRLAEAWRLHAEENAVRSHLAGFGLTHHQMETLLTKFGPGVVFALQRDPYMFIPHLAGFGFKRVDQMALKMGVAKTHPGRIEAALSHCLNEQIGHGHTWTAGAELLDIADEALAIDTLDSRDLIQAAGQRLLESGDLVAVGRAVTTQRLYEDERYIRGELEKRAWEETHLDIETSVESDLDDDQRAALRTALSRRVSVISGGAGTGKTYVVARLTAALQQRGASVRLCAPTGKAAKRIEQLLKERGVEATASTIHRLLRYDGHDFHEERIGADAVIVDEASMIDVRLMAELLRRLDLERTRLVLVGDHHQLPPVGPGNPLRDIIEGELAPATVMKTVHRFAGVLKRGAAGVLAGRIDPAAEDDCSRWLVIDGFREAAAIKSYLRDLVLHELPGRYGFDPVADIQIITPEHRGELGTRSINAMMQALLRWEVEGCGGRFAIGDKVIQTRNDYEIGVMNGTIGFVRGVERNGVTIEFEGCGPQVVEWAGAKHVQLAYALTAHKAQGSEFPCTVVLCHKSHYFADRNWLYTAVTRAAHTCVLLGDEYGLRRAARHVRNMQRRTLLGLWALDRGREAAA